MKQKLRNGTLMEMEDAQDKLIGRLYGSAFGRILLKPLTAPCLSRLAGCFLSSRLSCLRGKEQVPEKRQQKESGATSS